MSPEQLNQGIELNNKLRRCKSDLELIETALKSDECEFEIRVYVKSHEAKMVDVTFDNPGLFDSVFLALKEHLEEEHSRTLAEFESL